MGLTGSRIFRKFHIIHHKDKYISKLIRAFLNEALCYLVPQESRSTHDRPND